MTLATMMKRLEVQILRGAGHAQDEVATLTGGPARTIRPIAAETAVTSIDTETARRQRGLAVRARSMFLAA
jgi:hypothetical protein